VNEKEYQEHISQLLVQCRAVSNAKRKSYASAGDVLANFKQIAAATGMTKYQTWSVYFNKHVLSINNAIKYQPEQPEDASETMQGRIIDCINYLLLLNAMLVEDARKKSP
jgi:hypothetical protein